MKRKVLDITSRQNAKFKTWLNLLSSKGVKKEELCLVSGPKLIQEQIVAGRVEEWILPPKGVAPSDQSPTFRLTGELYNELDVIGTKSPLAVVRPASISPWDGGPPQGLDVILALSDPSNLGAALRSCEAFGATRVILAQECASPFLPRSIRASMGSVFRVPLFSGPSIQSLELADAVGLDMAGESILDFAWPRKMYLLLGEEGQGLPEQIELKRVHIPMAPQIESLNAMAAASIALFSYRKRYPL